MKFASNLILLFVCASLVPVLLPSEASADTSVAAANNCKGGSARTNGSIKNKEKSKRITVKCSIPRTAIADTDGALMRVTFARNNKTGKSFACTAVARDNYTSSESSDSFSVSTTGVGLLQTLTLTASDGTAWSGYYVLTCMVPAKSSLISITLDE